MDKKIFLEKSFDSLGKIFDEIENSKTISLTDFNSSDTAVVIVDMVNGFVKEGPMSSSRVLGINERIADFCKKCDSLNIMRIAFADTHNEDSAEFLSYPIHCLANTYESKITDEILKAGEMQVIEKNSTNGFIAEEFQKWISKNSSLKNIIVIGCCTDICVLQLSLNLKTYFNSLNRNTEVIVVKSMNETYTLEAHDGDLCNLMALYNMKINGIQIVKDII